MLRSVWLATLCLSVAACGAKTEADPLTSDSVAGDVLADSAITGVTYHGDRYTLTSDYYRKWLVAQAALDSLPEPTALPRVDLHGTADDDLDRTIAYLSDHEPERRAIEGSGLSVTDYVLTSVALGRMVALRSGDSTVVRAATGVSDSIVRNVRERSRYHVVYDDDDAPRGHAGYKAGKHHHGHGKKGGHGKH